MVIRNGAAFAGFVCFLGVGAAQQIPKERHFSFEYSVSVKDVPAGADHIDLWIPQPHDDPFQKITNIRIECPYPYQQAADAQGNRIVHVRVEHPSAPFSFVMRFEAVRKEHFQAVLREAANARVALTPAERQKYLMPDRLVPLDPEIHEWAQQVVDRAGAKTDLEKARAIYEHVVSTVKYDKTGKGWGRGDIYYACDARRGNCTDFHAIVIGYARSLGIPARFSIGFPLPADRGSGRIAGYHCWAELYVNGIGWIPVDASEAAKDPSRREYFFGAHDENRVQFTTGRDLVLAPKQAGDPLNYFVYPYAELDGKPYPNVETSYSYKDFGQTAPANSAGN